MSDNRRRIGTVREGNESLEGHASSSSQRAADTGTQIPEEESELGYVPVLLVLHQEN